MKTSRIILLSVGGAIAVAVIGLAISARILLETGGSPADDTDSLRASGTYAVSTYDITGYRGVRCSGSWEVTISEDAETVSVGYPENLAEYLIVEKRGGFLILSLEQGISVQNLKTLRATIPAKGVIEIEGSGAASIHIDSVDFDSLEIRTSGGSNVTADDSSIRSLSLNTSGATNVEFGETTVRTARINSSGAGNIVLLMNGGALSGSLSGAVYLRYRGNPGSVDVRTSGISHVTAD